MYVFAITVPVDPWKAVASVTLPEVSNSVGTGITGMHIFALSLRLTPATGPERIVSDPR